MADWCVSMTELVNPFYTDICSFAQPEYCGSLEIMQTAFLLALFCVCESCCRVAVALSRCGGHQMLASVILKCVTLHVYFCQRSIKLVAKAVAPDADYQDCKNRCLICKAEQC